MVNEVDGKVPVIAGTGSMSTWETILLTRDAADLGVDATLVITPFYFRPSNREIYEHYKSVVEAVDAPVILYSVPKFTGFHLDVNVISKLASEYDNVVGVKDSGGDVGRITEIIRLVGDKISVLAGSADLILLTLVLGGTGAIVAVANVIPKICTILYESFQKGDYEKASKLQQEIASVNKTLMEYGQISTIKAALNILGLPRSYPRKPALPLTDEDESRIMDLLKSMS